MWTVKERIACLLILAVIIAILFCPAQGYCAITLKGQLVEPGGTKPPLSNVLIFLYDWDYVKVNGLAPIAPIGITTTTVGDNNFAQKAIASAISLDEKKYPLNKEYLLVFSMRNITKSKPYPTFFYGATSEADYSNPSKFVTQPKWDDLSAAPRIKLTSGTYDLGLFSPPSSGSKEGFWLFGFAKNQNGHMPDVGIEIFADQNGVPVPLPYPFYKFIKTDENSKTIGTSGLVVNFVMGGFLKYQTYYIKAIANSFGYQDAFYMEDDKPKPFYFSDDVIAGDILLKPGAKIQGYIKDKDGNPVTDSIIFIQAVSYTGDQQVQHLQNYVHDPDYQDYDDLPDADRHYFGYDTFNYNSTGKYEIKGLPYEDQNYILAATELPGETPKKFATPVYYNGSDGAFNIKQAKTIKFSGAVTYPNPVNFFLKDGGCIKGYVSFEEEPSDHVKTVLGVDPNICGSSKIDVYVDAYQVDKNGSLLPMGSSVRDGAGPYAVCGLTPGEYIIKAHTPICLFCPGEFYDNQLTFITATQLTVDFGTTDEDNDMILSLGGFLEGRVLDSNSDPISKASVFVNQINAGNPLVGYFFVNSEGTILAQYPAQTDPNGRFYVWGLPEGMYTIFVNGVLEDENTGFLPQFYDPNLLNSTMLANQVSPFFVAENNPDFMTLETIQLTQVDAESGGIISGSISLDTSISGLVTLSENNFYMRLFNADTGMEISNPLYKISKPSGTVLPYSIMIPSDGKYILSVQDTRAKLLPHYYQNTVYLDEAVPLIVDRNPSTVLTGKNFVLSKQSGQITGSALDPNDDGISGLLVYARQQVSEGPDKGTWKSVSQAETDSDGAFTLKGLYVGTFIFSIHDPKFRYPVVYYHSSQNSYTPEGAEQRVYDLNGSSNLSPIVFNLEKGGRISGKVSNDFSGTRVYVYLVKEKPVTGYTTIADPNFEVPGLAPGEYVLGYKDPNLNYLSVYYAQSGFTTDQNQVNKTDIIIGTNTTKWVGEMDFSQDSQLAATIEGQINKETESGLVSMSENTFLFLYRMSGQKEFWATTPEQFVSVDSNGNYSLKGLSKGTYTIIAFGPLYRPISKTITIGDLDLGSVKQDVDLTFPLGWLNMKYERTLNLEKGLNLVAYPTRIPPYVTGYDSWAFLKDIVLVDGHGGMGLRTFLTDDQEWKSASFWNAILEGAQITGVHGKKFFFTNGQGFMLYSQEGPTLNFRYFPGQTALWLKEGTNLVGNVPIHPDLADVDDPDLISDLNFTTGKMLAQMGEDASNSIQTLDAKAGKWQATYWMWGKPAGTEVKVEDDRGYLVSMKKDLDNWYPTNNN